MNTTFVIDGGAGRVITAIPALEKYAMNNPNDDFRVLTAGWESLYWAHPVLQNRTYNINQKGVFDLHMKGRRVIHPEPYQLNEYYSQQKHLIECFDQEINKTNEHSDLDKPNLYLTPQEHYAGQKLLQESRKKTGKQKVIVLQPYGSGIRIDNDKPFDETYRSLDVDFTLKLIYNLSKNCTVIYFGEKQFYHPGDSYSINVNDNGSDLRMYMSLIANCDYFIGVDSVGQHMARAFNKPATVILGATFEQNVSYPNFNIYRNKSKPTYVPIRLSQIDCEFANNLNCNTMKFDEEDIPKILETIK
jgi:ADP-heptose:LPS heptosyltransferase